MIHAMIDVEALRLSKPWWAPLLEIGVVIFSDTGGVFEHRRILIDQSSLPSWADPEPDTVEFWKKQPYWPTLLADIEKYGMDAYEAMVLLKSFLEERKVEAFWFAGPQYDQVMLEAYFDDYCLDFPWKYNDSRDFRTIRKQYPVMYRALLDKRKGNHQAVDDCLFQVSVLREISKASGIRWQ